MSSKTSFPNRKSCYEAKKLGNVRHLQRCLVLRGFTKNMGIKTRQYIYIHYWTFLMAQFLMNFINLEYIFIYIYI